MIKINIGGCNNHHPKNFVIGKKEGSRDYLLIVTKSDAVFDIDGVIYETAPGTFVLFKENVPYSYYSPTGEYVNDWIHFECSGEEDMWGQLNIPMNMPVMLYDISTVSEIIGKAIREQYSDKKYSEIIVSHYMHILLYAVSQQIAEKADKVKSDYINMHMRELRSRIYSEPQLHWKIEDMCESLNLSQSYFQHMYKSIFHVSCIGDVINARVEKAKYYLLQSNVPVGNIAGLCGYKSEMHFSRQFKKKTGMSPRHYRDVMMGREIYAH